MSGFDHARDAVYLIATSVSVAVGIVEHSVCVENLVDRCASAHGINLTKHIFEIAKQQGGYAEVRRDTSSGLLRACLAPQVGHSAISAVLQNPFWPKALPMSPEQPVTHVSGTDLVRSLWNRDDLCRYDAGAGPRDFEGSAGDLQRISLSRSIDRCDVGAPDRMRVRTGFWWYPCLRDTPDECRWSRCRRVRLDQRPRRATKDHSSERRVASTLWINRSRRAGLVAPSMRARL